MERSLINVVITTVICILSIMISITFYNILMAFYLSIAVVGLIMLFCLVYYININDKGVFVVRNEKEAKTITKLVNSAYQYNSNIYAKIALFIPFIFLSILSYFIWVKTGLVFGPVVLSCTSFIFLVTRIFIFKKIIKFFAKDSN